MFQHVQEKLLATHGYLKRPAHDAARHSNEPVAEHFFSCSDEEVLDFLVLCFETTWNCGGNESVNAINAIFEQENIGYELTRIQEIPVDEPSTSYPPFKGGKAFRVVPPRALKKAEKRTHTQIIQPCLHALADPRFATANSELLDALGKMRTQQWADAITSFGSSFESVLKTICTIKNWKYDKNKDTCGKLVEICQTHNLFPSFYRPILEGIATIRNKTADAHGRGPAPEYQASENIARHMEHLTCAHSLFVIDQASL